MKILETKIPDLIFLDINLPDGNGLKELLNLKPRCEACEVVMMTAFDQQGERTEAIGSGAIDFLSKPFSLARLNQVLDFRFNPLTKHRKYNG